MDRPQLHYTAPEGPHGHWQITDDTGTVLACPHQPPAPQLLAALGIETTTPPAPAPAALAGAAEDHAAVPAPPGPLPVAGAEAGSRTVWQTTTGDDPVSGPDDPAHWTGQARWERLPAEAPVAWLPGAREALSRVQSSPQRIAAIVAAPQRVEVERGDAVACYGGGLRVVIGGDGTALHISADTGHEAPRTKAVGPRPGSGPRREPVPTDRQALIRLLHRRGFIVTRGGKHETVTHPTIRGMTTLPLTPSDHRWIHNAISEIRERFGIDVRAPQED